MDVDADLEYNQSSGVKSIEMHVPLTFKCGSRVLSATYTAILLVCVASVDKDIRSR